MRSLIILRSAPIVGANRTYLSIYESNSADATPQLLHSFSATLDRLSIPHRIITDKTTTRHWPHGASEERIAYLAAARNKALEPLASSDPTIRLEDYEEWGNGRVLFLNDVVFGWRSVVELLNTRLEGAEGVDGEGDYDLACAVDFGWSGTFSSHFFHLIPLLLLPSPIPWALLPVPVLSALREYNFPSFAILLSRPARLFQRNEITDLVLVHVYRHLWYVIPTCRDVD